MEFDDLLKKRAMIRAYKARAVEEEKIQKLLSNAIRAPSAGHLQPWDFIIVRDPATKKRLARAALQQDFIAQAPVVIVTCANSQRNTWRYGQRGVNFYSLIDTAFASLLILLTAANEGLGCCFVGAYNDEEVSRILGLPQGVRPVGIIPIGYPAERPLKAKRIPLEHVVHVEKWQGNHRDRPKFNV